MSSMGGGLWMLNGLAQSCISSWNDYDDIESLLKGHLSCVDVVDTVFLKRCRNCDTMAMIFFRVVWDSVMLLNQEHLTLLVKQSGMHGMNWEL